MSTTSEPLTSSERDARVTRAQTIYSSGLTATLVKVILLAVIDALLVLAVMTALAAQSWVILGVVVILGVAINVIYIPPNRILPGKYLAPGLIFMLIFSVSVMIYTVYISFTNYGYGHVLSKSDAIAAILKNSQERVPDSAAYPAGVGERDGQLWLIVVDPSNKQAMAGNNSNPLKPIEAVQQNSLGDITAAPGYRMLTFAELSSRSQEIATLQADISRDPEDGSLRTPTGSRAYLYKSTMRYDKAQDAMVANNGQIYRDSGHGSFVADDGTRIEPGWQINVGVRNYAAAVSNPDIRTPFLRVLGWTFLFAILTVLTTFALGLFLAMAFNSSSMRGQRFYRIIMILPYAFPSLMMTMVWAGLFNQEFGFINNVLLGGARLAWLTDPVLAKVAVLLVNLWLGFPYMFLVSTGALQSIPDDILEAAQVDGASGWRTFTAIRLPLLMVSLAPLLISSFAFNFNNFNLIFMLTQGGPRFVDTTLNVGATDILISMVYKVAFQGNQRDYGLGSAFAVLIFIIVGVVSAIGFRQTRTLEEIN